MKTYIQPAITVVEIQHTAIICTSDPTSLEIIDGDGIMADDSDVLTLEPKLFDEEF